MTIHDATEQAYKNGYEQGKLDALKWIPVTEPPKDGESVLCFVDAPSGCEQCVLQYHSCLEAFDRFYFRDVKRSGFVDYDSGIGWFDVLHITHWMPLTEAPKEDA